MFMKNSEEKRNTAWRTVLTVSSVLIIIVAVFFVVKLFTDNPLEGTWVGDEGDITLTFTDERESVIVQNGTISVTTECSVDKSSKVLTVRVSDEAVREQAEDTNGEITETQIQDLLDNIEGTYEYNIENTTLTLTEREYGSQMTFEKD
ncbi:MAG TPA: hypothetical protein H9711_03755 [Candidatus Mediterraneibacter intestinavium]|nr:hypothetical protein [Candidatus Mediterraneibacter intestinavium]